MSSSQLYSYSIILSLYFVFGAFGVKNSLEAPPSSSTQRNATSIQAQRGTPVQRTTQVQTSSKIVIPQIPARTPAAQKHVFKKGETLQLQRKDKAGADVTITPGPEHQAHSPSDGPAYFELLKVNNDLVLLFQTKDPNYHLSLNNPITIDLVPDYPLEVNPPIITNENWPKVGTQLKLAVSGSTPGNYYRILGEALFTYCHIQTKACHEGFSTIVFSYSP